MTEFGDCCRERATTHLNPLDVSLVWPCAHVDRCVGCTHKGRKGEREGGTKGKKKRRRKDNGRCSRSTLQRPKRGLTSIKRTRVEKWSKLQAQAETPPRYFVQSETDRLAANGGRAAASGEQTRTGRERAMGVAAARTERRDRESTATPTASDGGESALLVLICCEATASRRLPGLPGSGCGGRVRAAPRQ